MKTFVMAALLVIGTASGAFAQDHGHHGAPAPAGSPAAEAFRTANEKMHRDMAIEFSDSVEVDFVRGMIPHHQGAIDMARVLLEYGSDPEIRQLAEEIIAAQEKEIAMMREWLAKHAPAAGEAKPGTGG